MTRTLILSLKLLFFFSSFFLCSQNFQRIEEISGLSTNRDNNSISTADYDLDYDLDLLIVSKHKDQNGEESTNSKLFRNNNDGSFSDVTEFAGLNSIFLEDGSEDGNLGTTGLEGSKFGSFWGDYDNDGYPDLFFTNLGNVALYKNQRDGTFLEVTESSGITKYNGCNNIGATWFDYNNDGFLDLFVNDWKGCGGNMLYKNNGDGTFDDVSSLINSIDTDGYASFTMFPYDFNKDGWLDLFISNDLKKPNGLYINNQGNSFIDNADLYGLNSMIDDMSITINDFNLDGQFDFFITGIDENVLFENDGTNVFFDQSQENNIIIPEAPWSHYWGWGSAFEDYDLDGDEDLIIVNGSSFSILQKNMYFRNEYAQGSNTFTNLTDVFSFGGNSFSTEILSFDFDNDGDLDIIVGNTRGNLFFFENRANTTLVKSNNNWLKVSLEGTISNKNAFGTQVTITTDSGTLIRYFNGVSFISQNLKPLHFGLSEAEEIRKIDIKWPSGIEETYSNFNVNSHIKFTESNGYEVLTINPSTKILGCIDPNSCSYNPEATEDDNSCTYLNTPVIIGSTSSHVLTEEEYSFDPQGNDTTIEWSIEGGEILNGQNSNTIRVKWHLGTTGKVSVIEFNNNCSSTLSHLNVDLSVKADKEYVSIARIWNEALLNAIRNDFARPTVHARNLFHYSVAVYDVWSIFNETTKTYLIGNTVNGYTNSFEGFETAIEKEEAIQKAISYASYRLLSERFKNSPGKDNTLEIFDFIMNELGYSIELDSVDYKDGTPESLGNYIASIILDYGLRDGSNNDNDYENLYYQPINTPLVLGARNEDIKIEDPNRWQPLTFTTFIDQSGNVAKSTPDFLSPEWGNVKPFSLTTENMLRLSRKGEDYYVYHLPEHPPTLDTTKISNSSNLYKWNFALVSQWSSHLDPTDGIMIDISPATIGNIDISSMPIEYSEYHNFYKEDGGDISRGRSINPITNEPYKAQMVPRADYARVLAEFWADGPDSETPPGHWFTILNYVSDHPLLEKKLNGKGEVLSNLEWDIKTYFTLGGAMHDAAISAWSIKGWVDYIRPISSIRYMAKLGQSSDQSLDNYHPGGLPLIKDYVEVIENGDELNGENNENVGKIKLKAWRGHDYVQNTKTDVAGVGWILAKNWWPYQRPTFVTPPFAGFVSGHSTFSRAAAEVLTLLTGDEYFPGGIGEFVAKKDEFLVFEKGPSVDVTLQWATYRDASDQTSLSRIWGGIHPPADDIPGRLIGYEIGIDSYNFAKSYFNEIAEAERSLEFYPNPVKTHMITIENTKASDEIKIYNILGSEINVLNINFNVANKKTVVTLPSSLKSGVYYLKLNNISKAFIISQ